MKILDCTLRDGGYYTSWDFSRPLVTRYLKAMAAANIDIVEIGLRNFPKEQFLGAYAYSTDDFIDSLDVPESLAIAVMVDAKTVLSYDGSIKDAVQKLFIKKSLSRVSIVRIAAHFNEVSSCGEIASELKSLGYQVGFNLMQSGGRPEKEIVEVASLISDWNTIDVLYFADSLGNMNTQEVTRIIFALRASWEGELGIHTHNNQGRALDNSLTAISNGVQWIDSTILGMGRGAGNCATETLTLELEQLGKKYRSLHLWNLVLKDFQALQKNHGWGASLLYHFAASNGIHPSYVQDLLGDSRYTSDQITQALNHLAPLKASSFNASLLRDGVSGISKFKNGVVGAWNAKNWCAGKELLIIGAGTSVSLYDNAIESFIKKRNVHTLSLNIHNEIDDTFIDGYVAIDPMRLTVELDDYEKKAKPLFSSISRLPEEIISRLNHIDVRDYGYNLENAEFSAKDFTCTIPSLLSLAYTLALAKSGGASRIWLVGFDGYAAGDKRQDEMVSLLDTVKNSGFGIDTICITPTTYPLKQGSVYAPY